MSSSPQAGYKKEKFLIIHYYKKVNNWYEFLSCKKIQTSACLIYEKKPIHLYFLINRMETYRFLVVF
jgi:hypothetical protein